MKKACVYTFSNTLDNYGQVLQYLATQLFLEKLDYKAYILRKEEPKVVKIPIHRRIYLRVRGIASYYWHIFKPVPVVEKPPIPEKQRLMNDFFKT